GRPLRLPRPPAPRARGCHGDLPAPDARRRRARRRRRLRRREARLRAPPARRPRRVRGRRGGGARARRLARPARGPAGRAVSAPRLAPTPPPAGLLARVRDRRLAGAPSRARTVAYAASAFPANLLLQTFSAFVVYFYVDHLGVPAGWVAGAMIAHGILNAVLNPLVGAASDRRRTRWGRRVPWIGLGVVPLVVAFALVWMPLVVAVYDVAYVVVVLNVSALFPEIFRTTAERARGNAPRQIFGLVGMILGTAGAPLLYGTLGWTWMALLLAVVSLAFFAW